jgi:hypothetical protein
MIERSAVLCRRFLLSSRPDLVKVDGPVAVSGHEEVAGLRLEDGAGRHHVVTHLGTKSR